MSMGMGGHVRVGWEDNPYLPDGSLAKTKAQLVEVVVRMAECIGRPVASPDDARRIVGIYTPPVPLEVIRPGLGPPEY